ncbi:hypothetical protein J7M00_07020 [bacterium]|nr:hypothetical protein [bacterium]
MRHYVYLLFVSLIPVIAFAGSGISSTEPAKIPKNVLYGKVPPISSQKIGKDETALSAQRQFVLQEILAEDSIHAVLLPDDAVAFRIDATENTIEIIDNRDTLPSICIDALNTAPKWLYDDLYQSFRHLSPEIAESCANTILSAPDEQIDEVAFCVAHLSPEALSDERFEFDLLLINSSFIYRVADSLKYVELVEYGDFSSGDWYTTTAYWVVDSTLADTTLLEIPGEIYYWYVVHPKLSDEAPKKKDITGDTVQRTYGYFWREFLWTDPHPIYSYTSGGYPLLPDWIKMAEVLWIRNDTSLAADRWVSPANGALDILGEWVSTVLPDPPSATRPIQPNQIAYYHKGNCGEVQDLLCAASRTSLIPDLCVGTPLQDHVWNEFWDDGFPGELLSYDVWHTYQVDRWGGRTALAPHWGGYDKDRGGSKNINNCIGWRGDGYAIDRTPAYTYLCTLVVEVRDAAGNPVPGAEVMLASDSYYDHDGLYIADVRATDCNGLMVVAMGDSCPYYFRVDSPIGSEPSDPSYVNAFDGLGSGRSVVGGYYTASVTLPGTLDELSITELTPPSEGEKQVVFEFGADEEYVRGEGNFDSQSGTFSYRKEDGIVSVFICDSTNFALYSAGEPFSAYHYRSRARAGTVLLNLPDEGIWYAVLSEEETIENDNIVFAMVQLGYDLTPIANTGKPEDISIKVSPNPFNSSCVITVPADAVELEICDLRGNVVETSYPSGTQFASTSENNRRHNEREVYIWTPDEKISSGIYFVHTILENGQTMSKRIVYLK